MKFNYIQRILSSLYKKLGRQIAKKPIYFFITPIILSMAFSLGFLKMKFERDPDQLYTVPTERAMTEMKIIQDLFPMNYSSNFDIIRMVSPKNILYVMFRAKDGGDMLRKHIFYKLLDIDEDIHNMEVRLNGKSFKYSDICALNEGHCFRNTIAGLEPLVTEKNKNLKYPFSLDSITFAFQPFVINIGGVDADDDGVIKSIKAMRLVYILDNNPDKEVAIKVWQDGLLQFIKNITSDDVIVNTFISNSIEKEFEEFSTTMLPFTGIVTVIIMIFSLITCMTSEWVKCKPILGIFACISAILAIISAFGCVILCGFPYTDINIALPFLILGMEVDDAYVLIAAWRLTKRKWSVPKRMSECYSEAAVSVTITSVTNLSSFCIGILSPYKSVQIFCQYAAASVFFTFFYLIFFFGSTIAMSGYREHLNLHPFLCIKVDNISANNHDEEKRDEDFIMALFRDKLGELLTFLNVKIIVIALFFGNLFIGIWGFQFLREGMELSDAFSSDSNLAKTIEEHYQYFTRYPYVLHVVINKTMNYADPEVQQQVNELLQKFEKHPLISGEYTRISWLKFFKLLQLSPFGALVFRGYDLSDKQSFINSLNEVFLNIPLAKQFKHDILFNENFTEITATRYILLCENVDNITAERMLLEDAWKIADSSILPVNVHSLLFPSFEQVVLIRSVVIQIGWVTVILIAVIFFLFIPSVKCAICVSIAVVSSLIETIGYMAMWGVKLDLMSMIILLLGVGLSINYPAHTTFSFMMSKREKPNEKMKNAIYSVGMPIVQGSFSTIIGISVLLYRWSYMLVVCFKIVFLIIVTTAFHSLLVIPVILSIIEKYKLTNISSVKRLSCKNVIYPAEEESQSCIDKEEKPFRLKNIFFKGLKNEDVVFVNNTLV